MILVDRFDIHSIIDNSCDEFIVQLIAGDDNFRPYLKPPQRFDWETSKFLCHVKRGSGWHEEFAQIFCCRFYLCL